MAAKVGDAVWLQQSLETKKVDLHSMNDDVSIGKREGNLQISSKIE